LQRGDDVKHSRFVFLCAAAWMAGAPAAAAQSKTAARSTTDVVAGKEVFDSQCAWCHGTDGDGGTGPNLHGRLRHATDYKSIVDIVINGVPGTEMPSFKSPLTERNARQVAAYVQSLSRAPVRSGGGNAQHGAALYAANGCASCHVVNGDGGILGPELTTIGSRRGPAYLRDALVKPEATHPPGYLVVRAVQASGPEIRGIRVNEDVFWVQIRDAGGTLHSLEKSTLTKLERQLEATLMPSYATRLSESDLTDIVTYLGTLRGAK
jgi:putative heme-binding domain-containing protein